MKSSVTMKENNTKAIQDAIAKALDLALEECGSVAEGYAKGKCPVDTGLLRNSITYAVHGGGANINSYTADKPSKSGEIRSGSYSGSADDEEPCVYIGTNVEYAAYVEMGSSGHPTPRPFLKPAVDEHQEKYREILEKHMKEFR